MTILARPTRDSAFKQHLPGESIVIMSKIKRSTFDDTTLLRVRFDNGLVGTLLESDIREVEPLPIIGGM